jgi:tetratricopeptide (TPR) repeat protein
MTHAPSTALHGVSTPETSGRLLNGRQATVAVLLITLAVHSSSFVGGFVLDDIPAIVEDPAIRSFATAVHPEKGVVATNRRPMLRLTLALNHALSGTNPWSYHLVNVLLHAGAAVAVLHCLLLLFRSPALRERFPSGGVNLALACTVLWSLHPLQTESVTYIVQRAEVMGALGILLALYCAMRSWTEASGVRRWEALAILAFLLGAASKETAAVAPFLVLVVHAVFWRRRVRDALAEAPALYGGLGVILAAGIVVSHDQIFLSDRSVMYGILHPMREDGGLAFGLRYVMTQAQVIPYYLRLAIWPSPLVLHYGWQMLFGHEWPLIIRPGLILLAVLIAGILLLAGRRPSGAAIIGFFILLIPSSFVYALNNGIFEHRMYLPLLAMIVPIATVFRSLLIAFLGDEEPPAQRGPGSDPVTVVGVLLVATVASLYTAQTIARNQHYRTRLTLYRDNVQKRPENALTHYNYGNALLRRRDLDAAIHHFRRSLEWGPPIAVRAASLGQALYRNGDKQRAAQWFKRCMQYEPGTFDAATYSEIGWGLAEVGELRLAERAIALALERDADYRPARDALEAIRHEKLAYIIETSREAVEADPDDPLARVRLSQNLERAGRQQEAQRQMRSAIRLFEGDVKAHPDDPAKRAALGRALLAAGELMRAETALREAIRLGLDSPEQRLLLAIAWMRQGELAQAEKALREVRSRAPNLSLLEQAEAELREKKADRNRSISSPGQPGTHRPGASGP